MDDLDLYFVTINTLAPSGAKCRLPNAAIAMSTGRKSRPDVSQTIFVAQWGWYSGGALKRPQLPARSKRLAFRCILRLAQNPCRYGHIKSSLLRDVPTPSAETTPLRIKKVRSLVPGKVAIPTYWPLCRQTIIVTIRREPRCEILKLS